MLSNLFEILIFGSLITLGILLISNSLQVNRKANIWFGTFLLIWASYWLEEIISLISAGSLEFSNTFYVAFIQFFSPVTFFVSIRYFTNPAYKIGRDALYYLAIPIVYLTLLILQNFLSINIGSVMLAFILIHGLAYIILSLFQLRKHKKHILNFSSNIVPIDLAWLAYIIWATLFLILGISVFNLLFFEAPLNLFMNGFVFWVVLFTAHHVLRQKEIFPVDENERTETLLLFTDADADSIQNKIMTNEKLIEEKSRLHEFLVNEEPFLDPELSLGKLAKMLHLTSHQLSYVINNGFNQNFYGYINKFRVDKAKKLLIEDNNLEKYSMIGIAFESGFNSKTAFNTAFKKITGQTPSEFKKSCSNL
jgi:AraC-like DNA-binding protein